MPLVSWLLLIGCFGVGVWQLAVWRWEVRVKQEKYSSALAFAKSRKKPLLIAGGPYGHRRIRHLLKMPAHGGGDVCLDIDRNAVEGHPKAVVASVTDIPFSDKSFGAAFASHLLEHLPTTGDAAKALSELGRIADGVFVVSPSKQSFSGWIHPDHHLWVWQDSQAIFVEQRGKGDNGNGCKTLAFSAKSHPTLQEEVELIGSRLFRKSAEKRTQFIERVLDICRRVEGKEFLVIHNPGGWGGTRLEELQEWERSVIDGVLSVLNRAGYAHLLVQHFRGGSSLWAHMRSSREQAYFLLTGRWHAADEMAAELNFLARLFPDLKILLLGASQGAAFSNAAMRMANGLPHVYSIELGLIFLHLKRRVITERTLALDSNGTAADPIVQLNLGVTLKAYFSSPYRWIKYRLQGQPRKLSNCINAPGHDYNWTYPGVSLRIEEFLLSKFGKKEGGG